MAKLARLPNLLDRKIYKTGQTRGADDDEIYQNRVGRNSTILIPYSQFPKFLNDTIYRMNYENGYIVLLNPGEYSEKVSDLRRQSLELGKNALLFYETREQWNAYNPFERGMTPANSRKAPLGGEFVARIPATTAAENGGKITYGFTETKSKGAGIRAYEYAPSGIMAQTRLQLEAVYWYCKDALSIAADYGMKESDAAERKSSVIEKAQNQGLLNHDELIRARIINSRKNAICPLCLEELLGRGFFTRLEQAEGREVIDLTVTSLNLFHIEELRYGTFNHRPYNLGWGHHYCNVVVRDIGIVNTLLWMNDILRKNQEEGYIKF
ncbi:MAG: BstXI family restriction endonuclease [Treponema sp.]|jgi:hypothetical protein|nr:BstXI family restriction endonuclease [Treponema sp.]